MEIEPTEFFPNGSNPYRYVLHQGNWIMEMRLSNSDHLLRAARQDAGLILDIANSCIRQEERLFNGVPLTIYNVDSGKTPTWRWDEQHNRIFGMVNGKTVHLNHLLLGLISANRKVSTQLTTRFTI
jgi:hypothetical protein